MPAKPKKAAPILRVRLSYSHSDRADAELLRAKLMRLKGVDFTFDAHEFKKGENLLSAIERLIDEADIVLVLLSEKSIASPWLWIETTLAKSKQKAVIPVVKRPLQPETLPLLGRDLCVMYAPDRPDVALRDIAEAIRREREALDQISVKRVWPPDKEFLLSKPVYQQMPGHLRDDFHRIAEWLNQNAVIEGSARDWEEIYLVALRAKTAVGVLYATLYKERHHKCFVSALVCDRALRGAQRVEVLDALVGYLEERARELDPRCEAFFFEVEKPSAAPQPVQGRGRARYLRYLQDKHEALGFTGVEYLQPDLSGQADPRHEVPLLLMCKSGRPRKTMTRQEFVRDVLGFVYGRVYLEAYTEEQDAEKHFRYIRDLKRRVTQSVAEEVGLEPVVR